MTRYTSVVATRRVVSAEHNECRSDTRQCYIAPRDGTRKRRKRPATTRLVEVTLSSILFVSLLSTVLLAQKTLAYTVEKPTVTRIGLHTKLSELYRYHPGYLRFRSALFNSKKDDVVSDASDSTIGIGIDLGTTFSAVAIVDEETGAATIVPVPHNGRTMPSVISIKANGDSASNYTYVVGREAINLEPTIGAYRNVKRVIGSGGKISQETLDVVPFCLPNSSGKTHKKRNLANEIHDALEYPTLLKVLPSFRKGASNDSDQGTIEPHVISSQVIQRLKTTVEDATHKIVTRAVIGVPAYFNDAQRDATIKAAKLAGIEKCQLLREPEAAALAYERQQSRSNDEEDDNIIDELVLVFDLGGGTLDVSMLLVGGGVTEIICTAGNAQLGGSSFDHRIAMYIEKMLKQDTQISTKKWSIKAKNNIVLVAEMMRIRLSNAKSISLSLPTSEQAWTDLKDPSELFVDNKQSNTTIRDSQDDGSNSTTCILCEMSRALMESLCQEEMQALIIPIRQVAIMSGAMLPGDARPSAVDAAIQADREMREDGRGVQQFDSFYNDEEEDNDNAGGTKLDTEVSEAMMQQLQEMDMKMVKKAQQGGRKRARTVAKEERKFRQQKRQLQEQREQKLAIQQQQSSNVKVRDGITGTPISRVVLVGGATRMPMIGRLLQALTGTPVLQKTVNPDEAVALGCAVRVGILDGKHKNAGTVLNPMQAAILRALAEREDGNMRRGGGGPMLFDDDDDDDDDEDEMIEEDDFDSVEYF